MRIGRLETERGIEFAVSERTEGWVPLSALGFYCDDTPSVLNNWRPISEAFRGTKHEVAQSHEIRFHCPIVRPSKILGIGLNYLDHIDEANLERPERPALFAKYPSALIGPYDPIVVDPELTNMADWEVELAVVIGERSRSVAEGDALSAIAGYSIANDVSARDWQFKDNQISRSKSYDTFCPIGPWITTADEIPDPQSLAIRCSVNGIVRQNSSTKHMLFSISYLLHYLSRTMTLEPGDVILTGTPHGTGMAMNPPTYLQPGDTVNCEVEGLGRISNPVVRPASYALQPGTR